MASASLLQMLAEGGQQGPSVLDRFNQGQEKGLRLDEILGQRESRQFIAPALGGDQGALAKLLYGNPELGVQISNNIERRADRKSDVDWRQSQAAQSQKNADRAYQLDMQQFGQTVANQNWERRLQEQALASKGPNLEELYDPPTGQPYKAVWNPTTRQYDRVGGTKAPSGTSLEVGPDGTVSFTQGMGKMTEGQSKDVGYLNRMTTSLPTIDQYEGSLTSLGQTVGGSVPVVGNYAKSADYQLAEQAGNNFLTALLRKESGATVPPAEQKSYGDIFLPRPGDKPPVIAQKREARRQAAIGVRMGLPAPIIKNMILQGVDFTKLEAPAGADAGGKGDQQPQTRRTKSGVEWSP